MRELTHSLAGGWSEYEGGCESWSEGVGIATGVGEGLGWELRGAVYF